MTPQFVKMAFEAPSHLKDLLIFILKYFLKSHDLFNFSQVKNRSTVSGQMFRSNLGLKMRSDVEFPEECLLP